MGSKEQQPAGDSTPRAKALLQHLRALDLLR